MKVSTRNNILKKLVSSKWRTNISTTITTALVMCYSIAECVAPVCARSSHTDILDPKLNKAWRAITGCYKSIYIDDMYLLAGIVPSIIRSDVYARKETAKWMEHEAPSLIGHNPARSRLKSRNEFLTSIKPSYFLPKSVKCISRGDQGTSCA